MDNERKLPVRRVVSAVIVPSVDTLMNDALSIIGSELANYRQKIKKGKPLEAKEARCIKDYIESLCKLSREAREQARSEDMVNLTDEQLKAEVDKLLKGRSEIEEDFEPDPS